MCACVCACVCVCARVPAALRPGPLQHGQGRPFSLFFFFVSVWCWRVERSLFGGRLSTSVRARVCIYVCVRVCVSPNAASQGDGLLQGGDAKKEKKEPDTVASLAFPVGRFSRTHAAAAPSPRLCLSLAPPPRPCALRAPLGFLPCAIPFTFLSSTCPLPCCIVLPTQRSMRPHECVCCVCCVWCMCMALVVSSPRVRRGPGG